MAGPYDYSINIPQPPAQNFLQSLMGIRQLQQMEDQSAIQQQQAAIAQQNAAFQQQMQPLEMARVKAATDAARASTGLTDVQTKSARENLTALQDRNALVKTYQNKAFEMAKDPTSWTPESLKSLQMMAVAVDPQGVDSISKFAEKAPTAIPLLTDAATYVSLAANSGRPDLIVPKLEKYISAVQEKVDANPNDKIANIQLQFLKTNLATAMVDPNAAALEAASFLASSNDKAYDNFLKGVKQPVEIKEIEAKTKKELAAARVEEAKLTPGGKEMSDKQQDDINKLTYASSEIRNTADSFNEQLNLILDFAEQNPKEFKTGALADIENWASGKQGVAQQAKNLRSNFQRFATEDWIKRAEPLKGGLNKEEGERLERGVPDIMTATPSEILNYGRLVLKLNLLEADQKELNAAWQQNARSLQAKAPAEFEAAGITVRAGERWSEAQTRLRDSYKKKNEKQIQEDALRIKRIQEAGKSGQSLVPNMYNLGGAPQQQQPAPDLTMPPAGAVRRLK